MGGTGLASSLLSKSTRSDIPGHLPSMPRIQISAIALGSTLALAACIPPAPEPTPVPTPTPVAQPSAAPVQTVTPTYDNWMDAPQSPGDWSYVRDGTNTLALFGTSRTPSGVSLIIGCDLATRRVSISRAGETNGQVEMLVRTETQDRVLTAGPLQAQAPLITAELSPSDRLLDAIAFSKGRFAIETAVTEPLYAPAWPEITRVIEDCRG